MHLFRTVRYSLLILTVALSLAYLIAVTQGLYTLTNIWKTFHDFCISSGNTFVNYLFMHDRFASLFIILMSSIGLMWAATYVIRQIYYAKRLRAQLRAKKLIAVSDNNDTMTLVNDNRPFALTVGFLQPHTYLSSKLKEILSEKELTCVTAHERHHRHNYDPLFSLILETVSRLLFFLPSIRYIVKRAHVQHEIAADQSALQNSSTEILASALLKSVGQGAPIAEHGAGIGFSTISERVTYLINPALEPAVRFSWLSIVWPAMMFFFVLLAATASLKPNDVHAQITSATGPMSHVDANHCGPENFSYFSRSFPIRSEMNMSVILAY